ncbi:MAG TPA: chromate transporter [Eubacteriales bacterium]|nr:chromate transporter [Eubacteriales bacterium]
MIFLQLFWTYFKIGLFTIGGGYAMLPLIRQQVIGVYVSEQLFWNMLAVSEATPGPFAINLATFVGMNVGINQGGIMLGFFGAFVATTAVILPSLIIVTIVSKLFIRFKNSKLVQGALYGIRPVVVGLVFSALIMVTLTLILPNVKLDDLANSSTVGFDYVSLIFLAAFTALSFIKIKGKRVNPLILIGVSAVAGIVLFAFIGL